MIGLITDAQAAAVAGQAELRRVRGSQDNKIRVAVSGQGPLVLMVHGFPELWFAWRYQMGPIAQAGFTAAAMDVRGYGGSDKPEGVERYSLHTLANDIAAVIEQLGAMDAVLIGHDWGCQQVYTTALLHPDKVRAVIAFSSSATHYSAVKPSTVWPRLYGDKFFYHRYFFRPGVAEAEIMRDPKRFLRYFYHGLSGRADAAANPLVQDGRAVNLLDSLPSPPQQSEWLSEAELDYCAEQFAAGGITGPLNRYRAVDLDVDQLKPWADRRIEQPALWIGGGRDPARFMIPGVDRYDNVAERLADLRGKVVVEHAGHWIPQEAPAEVNAEVMAFLQRL